MSAVEKDTNQLLRKKYFVNSESVLHHRRTADSGADKKRFTPIIEASRVSLSPVAIRPEPGKVVVADSIKVNVIKDGDTVTSIRIKCPCGRHAELDCQYAPAEAPHETPPTE